MAPIEKKISVALVTYNHERYIRQALNGILAQKTGYPFEIVVGDDSSTDGTRSILEKYQNKFNGVLRILNTPRNVGSLKNFQRTLQACEGEYIALCEGDDYWNDPLKLEKQTRYMDENPGCGLVHTNYNLVYEKKQEAISAFNTRKNQQIPTGNILEDLLLSSSHFIQTCTVMVRKGIVDFNLFFEDLLARGWRLGDLALWLEFARRARIDYLPDVTGTYRLIENSASRQVDLRKHCQFHQSVFEIKYHYWKKYSKNPLTGRRILSSYYSTMIGDAYKMRDYRLAKASRAQAVARGIAIPRKQLLKLNLMKLLFSKNTDAAGTLPLRVID